MPKAHQNFPMVEASMDRSMNPILTSGPSHVTGVDAREQGSALKFPGFVATTMASSPTVNVTRNSFHPFSIQKGTANGVLRGFIQHNTNLGRIEAVFYDSVTSAWSNFLLATDASTTVADAAKTDVTSAATFVFMTYLDSSSNQQGRTFFFDGSNFVAVAFGVGSDEGWTGVGTPAASAGGQLAAGEYRVAIRLIDTRRNVITGLSEQTTITGVTAGQDIESTASITLPTGWDSTTGSGGKTKVRYYRTIADDSTYYLERQGDYDGATMTLRWGGSVANGGLTDLGLVNKNDPYDTKLDKVGLPPATGRIGHHQGITVMQLEGDVVDEGNTDLVFSPSHDWRPEDFPRSNVYRLGTDIGDVVQFVRGGDFLAAMTESAMIRFHKQGTALAANAFELGWGPRSRFGSVAVGATIFSVSESGLYMVNAGDGTYQSVQAVERLITNDWVTNIKADTPATAVPNIHTAYDEALGAVFFVNNATQEALVFWTGAGRITLLEDFPWTFSATLPDPATGGPKRAWFASPADSAGTTYRVNQIWSADVDSTGSLTMSGLTAASNTLNGTLSAASPTDELTDTGETWLSEVLGATVYIFTGTDETPQKAIVDGPTDQSILASDNFNRANNNSLGSDWTEQEEDAGNIIITSNKVKNDGAVGLAIDDYETAGWNGSQTTFAATDEPYVVEADIEFSAITNRPEMVYVYGRMNGVVDLSAGNQGYLVAFKADDSSIGGNVQGWNIESNKIELIRRDGNSTFVSLGSAAFTPVINTTYRLGLEFNGSSIKLLLDGVTQISVTDSTYTSGQVGFGFATGRANWGNVVTVDNFQVVKSISSFSDTLELDRNISGMAVGDKYTISPVKYEVRMPAVGNPGERLWNRHTVEQIGAYITNLKTPTPSTNNRFRFVTFRAGSDTVQTSQWVTLTENPDDLVGHLASAHGFGVQPGVQNYEAGSSFELVGTLTWYYAMIGNTRITAN